MISTLMILELTISMLTVSTRTMLQRSTGPSGRAWRSNLGARVPFDIRCPWVLVA
jgi:hypothetical protein